MKNKIRVLIIVCLIVFVICFVGIIVYSLILAPGKYAKSSLEEKFEYFLQYTSSLYEDKQDGTRVFELLNTIIYYESDSDSSVYCNEVNLYDAEGNKEISIMHDKKFAYNLTDMQKYIDENLEYFVEIKRNDQIMRIDELNIYIILSNEEDKNKSKNTIDYMEVN